MICALCPTECQQAIDGLCRACRLRKAIGDRQKYFWTPELDAALRRAYTAKSKAALGVAIRELMRRTRFPRCVLQNRAQALGIRFHQAQPWTAEEIGLLCDLAGAKPPRAIAGFLSNRPNGRKRTALAVRQKLFALGLGIGVTEGYSRNELAQRMGVHHARISRWISQGWLRLNDQDRIPHGSVERFLWDHMEDYRFAACDDWWLKTMLKPLIGVKHEYDRKPVRREAA
jgi:hypothetical protein